MGWPVPATGETGTTDRRREDGKPHGCSALHMGIVLRLKGRSDGREEEREEEREGEEEGRGEKKRLPASKLPGLCCRLTNLINPKEGAVTSRDHCL